MIAPSIVKETRLKWPNEKVDLHKRNRGVPSTKRVASVSPIPIHVNLADSNGLTFQKLLTEVADAIGNRLHSNPEDTFKQRLLEDGLLSEIKPVDDLPDDKWTPIRAKGKPISEVVIEERR